MNFINGHRASNRKPTTPQKTASRVISERVSPLKTNMLKVKQPIRYICFNKQRRINETRSERRKNHIRAGTAYVIPYTYAPNYTGARASSLSDFQENPPPRRQNRRALRGAAPQLNASPRLFPCNYSPSRRHKFTRQRAFTSEEREIKRERESAGVPWHAPGARAQHTVVLRPRPDACTAGEAAECIGRAMRSKIVPVAGQ